MTNTVYRGITYTRDGSWDGTHRDGTRPKSPVPGRDGTGPKIFGTGRDGTRNYRDTIGTGPEFPGRRDASRPDFSRFFE